MDGWLTALGSLGDVCSRVGSAVASSWHERLLPSGRACAMVDMPNPHDPKGGMP